MNSIASHHPENTIRGSFFNRLARNYLYVLAGLPIVLISFPLLVTLTVVSVATLVIWLGLLLLPVTLLMASAFAALSRRRLLAWGATFEPGRYRPLEPGIIGKLRIITEPRRWLDLVFETVIAFPLRITNFVLAMTWTVVGLGGVTYFVWSVFVPGERSFIQLLQHTGLTGIPETDRGQYLLDSGAAFTVGVLFILTLAPVMSGVASLDALLTRTLLGTRGTQELLDQAPQRAEAYENVSVATSTSFSSTAWSRTGAVFAAVVLLAVGWPVIAVVYSTNAAVAMILVTMHCAAIIVALRWTAPTLVVSLLASGALMLLTASDHGSVWPWPVTVLLTQCAVLIVAGLIRPWYYAVSGWSAGVVLTIVVLISVAPVLPAGAMSNSIIFASVSAGAVVAASLSRMWIRNAGRLKDAERTSAIQDRRSKELTERNRIAHELHDVVAHSMSVISVQAATAQYRNPGIDEASQREFTEIAGSARQALTELRLLLSILRNEDDPPTVPTPGLNDIDSLVEATRVSGTEIHYRGLDTANEALLSNTAPATALAAYRTVQEALSNALRHSPGSQVDVELTVLTAGDDTHWIRIAVTNTAPPHQTAAAPGSGLGLTGIRERTAAVGGTTEAGPTPDGGFAVFASLPL